MMAMDAARKKQLVSLIDELRGAVEELLLTGLTTASKSTLERIDVSFKEASRMRLLRLGSTLRIANEEIARFTGGARQFSPRRLSFFLSRTWMLATGMRAAIEGDDDAQFDRLMATPASVPLERLKVVTLGVSKRVVPGAFATFEFRLRAVEDSGPVKAGEPLTWSCVFPMREGLDLPAEAFLHLPQKQKFKPSILLERKVVEIGRCAIARQATSASRIMLGDSSEMKAGDAFSDWKPLWTWAVRDAAARLERHEPTPLDLDVELQEEVFLDAWEPGEWSSAEEGYDALPLRCGLIEYEARLDRGPSGTPALGVTRKLSGKKKRPPLFGIVHYESCRFVFQPLTALGKDGPEYLTVSPDKISQAELVKAMKFT
jgi:hypothetical protein